MATMEDGERDALLGKVHTLERQLAQVNTSLTVCSCTIASEDICDAVDTDCRLSGRRSTSKEKPRYGTIVCHCVSCDVSRMLELICYCTLPHS